MTTTAPSPATTKTTRIGRALDGEADLHPGEAGFLLVPDGVNAMAIRLLLADQAEICIDAQYYEIDDDLTGHLFIEALLRAAQRGVKVRLLIDDYRTEGHDANLAALREQRNMELRIYNPFERKTSRIIEGLTSFSRVNGRMHNKSFTVDNQMTVIGGRNIGDPYFNVSDEVNFADLDAVGIGPIVADVSNMFDEYWNSPAAISIDRLMKEHPSSNQSLSKLMIRLKAARASIDDTKYADAINNSILEKLQHDLSMFTWAPYKLGYDLPAKTQRGEGAALVRNLVVEEFNQVETEVVLISPYFVPRLTGVRRFADLRNRGVKVAIVTNSLASTNQIYAHGGYAPVRRPLLKMGVRLFELRADAEVRHQTLEGSKPDSATLHTKAFAIDRRKLFIGSFNFDPRSANINTEVGVFIESPKLATMVIERTFEHAQSQSYEVLLGSTGRLEWHGWNTNKDGTKQKIVLHHEPNTSAALRAAGIAAQLLPIRGQI